MRLGKVSARPTTFQGIDGDFWPETIRELPWNMHYELQLRGLVGIQGVGRTHHREDVVNLTVGHSNYGDVGVDYQGLIVEFRGAEVFREQEMLEVEDREDPVLEIELVKRLRQIENLLEDPGGILDSSQSG